MRVLVFGAAGMLGQAVMAKMYGERNLRVEGLTRKDLDLSRATDDDISRVVSAAEPDFVINCAGVLRSAIREDDPPSLSDAVAVNRDFPHRLGAAAEHCGARLVHMSTDAVFSSRPSPPFTELDAPDAADFYGRTKASGEPGNTTALTVRCSLLGTDEFRGRGLLEWLRRTPEGSEVRGFTDRAWNGVTTRQFARLCIGLMTGGLFDEVRRRTPHIHFCPNQAISKYDILCLWRDVIGKKVHIVPADAPPGSTGRLLATVYPDWKRAHPDEVPWPALIRELARQPVPFPHQRT